MIYQIGLRRMCCENMSEGVESEGVVTNREFREVLEDRTARYAVDVFKHFAVTVQCGGYYGGR